MRERQFQTRSVSSKITPRHASAIDRGFTEKLEQVFLQLIAFDGAGLDHGIERTQECMAILSFEGGTKSAGVSPALMPADNARQIK